METLINIIDLLKVKDWLIKVSGQAIGTILLIWRLKDSLSYDLVRESICLPNYIHLCYKFLHIVPM